MGHKTDFETALEKCKAIPADDFFDELEHRLGQHYEAETLTSTDKNEYEQLKKAFLYQSKRFMASSAQRINEI